MTDQHIRPGSCYGQQHGSELVRHLGGGAGECGVVTPASPGPVVEDRRRELAHAFLYEREVETKDPAPGTKTTAGSPWPVLWVQMS